MKALMKILIITAIAVLPLDSRNFPPVELNTATLFIVDNSLSMRNSDPDLLRFDALKELILDERSGQYLASMLFNDKVRVLQELSSVEAGGRQAIYDELKEQGSELGYYTDIHEALAAGLMIYRDTAASFDGKYVFLLSDGSINVSEGDEEDARKEEDLRTEIVQKYMDQGLKIIAAALSADTDTSLLRELAALTGGNYYYAENAEALDSCFSEAAHFMDRSDREIFLNKLQAATDQIAAEEGNRAARDYLNGYSKDLKDRELQVLLADYPEKLKIAPARSGSGLIYLLLLIILIALYYQWQKLRILQGKVTELQHQMAVLQHLEVEDIEIAKESAAPETSGATEAASENVIETDKDEDKKEDETFIRSTDLDEDSFISLSNDHENSVNSEMHQSSPGEESFEKSAVPADPGGERHPVEDQSADSMNNHNEIDNKNDQCSIHPNRKATVQCSHCGNYYCSSCVTQEDEGTICEVCKNKEDTRKMLGIV